MYRWIMYIHQNAFSQPFDLTRQESLSAVRKEFESFAYAVKNDDISATLYEYDDESWKQAEKFSEIGCPFDYPARIVEFGPRGGLRVVKV